VYDPSNETVGSDHSDFYTALWSTFEVDHTDSLTRLGSAAAGRPYVALVYRWRTGAVADLKAVLDELPEDFSVPFIVAGPDDPTAVRNALVTEADDYVPAGTEAARKLETRLNTERPVSKTAGVETIDTAALHEAIVEQMQDTAWVLDENLRISYVNSQVVDRTCLTATDLIGKSLLEVVNGALLSEADYKRFEQGLKELLAGDRQQFRIQLTFHPATTPSYTADILALPYRDIDGTILGVVGIGRDITDQLVEQRQMERQNDLFRQAQQLADIGGWAWNLTDDTVELTDEVYAIYEISTEFEPTIENIYQYHPDTTDELTAAFEQLRTGKPADLEAKLQTPTGADKWVRIHGSPKETDGELTEIIGSVQDITERRRLETQLRENVKSLRELYQLSADTTLSFPDRIERVLELTCDRLDLSYGFLTTVSGESQQIVYAYGGHNQLQPGERSPLSQAYCRKTIRQDSVLTVEDAPEEGWAEDPAYQTFGLACYLGGKVTVDGRLYGTLCFADNDARDRSFTDTELAFVEVLTKWVSYQLERRSTESKLRELQETTQAFLTADDESAVAALAMDAAIDILELPLTALWRYDPDQEALIPVDQTDESDNHFDGQPQFEAGEGLIWKAFAMNTVAVVDDVQANPNRYNHDTAIKSEIIVPVQSYGVLVTATLEQRSFSDLEVDLLRILATSVSAAMVRVKRETELKQQNDRLSEFTGYVSHDLRNPLSVAQGYIQQAIETEDVNQLAAVVRAHDRMESLIEDMLLLARKGEVIGSVEPTNVETVAQNAWDTVDSRDAEFVVEGELKVTADSSRLQQVFENLFRNSVEHGSTKSRTQSGDSVEDDGPGLTVTVRCQEDRFVVADDGRGFGGDPPRFEPATETESGLGLSIVSKIIDAHGWSITARDGDSGGCQFDITGFETPETPVPDTES
jgi:PAS domain S-box-containing protein